MQLFRLLVLTLFSGRSVNGTNACQRADRDEGSCHGPVLAEDMGSHGTALLQAKQQRLQALAEPAPSKFSKTLLQALAEPAPPKFAALEQQVADVEKDGFAVVIPGLGNEYRAAQVAQNIQWLKMQDVPFECWIFVYRSAEEFPLKKSRFEPCHIVRREGYWMSHVLSLPLDKIKKPWVLHMLDGIQPQPDVNLTKLTKIMRINGLGHASPTFDSERGDYVPFYELMVRQADYRVGRFVDFIEMHFDVFSRRYFACLQDTIDPANTLGWGVDLVLPAMCGGTAGKSDGHTGRMGVLDQMTMAKKFSSGYNKEEAAKQMDAFVGKYTSTGHNLPEFRILGELEDTAFEAS